MSFLHSVIFASRCRSTHHYLALDALRFLKGPDAAGWRNLLLHHHDQYLKGAKAPDDVFKDYKNHVLHAREGEWGGAIEAAQEWRKRTIRAMKDKDWSHVAWCAGVMSHYVVDPCQPFHTHQTEEENVIHRAAEWSFFKSYATFQSLLQRELGGYPDIGLSEGGDWLADVVRQGARAANLHYETIIDHFNFAAAAKRPAQGLDHELRLAIARLIGRAAVSWARVFDRMCAEASVKPPKLDGGMQALFLAFEAPFQNILGLVAEARERSLVAAQYEEYRKTGKVRSTLSEDDSTVRALHAAEVLKVPLSSLDARWPREIGTAHKPGKPKKTRTKAKTRPAKGRKPAPIQSLPMKPAAIPEAPAPVVQAAKPAPAVKPAAPPAQAPVVPPPAARAQTQPTSPTAPAAAASPFFNPAAPTPKPQQPEPPAPSPAAVKPEQTRSGAVAPATAGEGAGGPKSKSAAKSEPAPKPEPAQSRTAKAIDAARVAKAVAPPSESETPPLLLTKKVVDKKKRKRGAADDDFIFTLKGASTLLEAPSIETKIARRFQSVGIRTVSDLLALSPATAAVLLDARNVAAPDIADWQAQAMLACTIPDLSDREAQALVGCDLRGVEAVAKADAKALAEAMRQWAKREGARAWGGGPAPSEADAESLIERAQAAYARRPKTAA